MVTMNWSESLPTRAGSLIKPRELITYLDDGSVICHDHHLRVCNSCGLDLTFDEYDHNEAVVEEEKEYLDETNAEIADQQSAIPMGMLLGPDERSFVLFGSTARYIPQWQEDLVGGAQLYHRISQRREYDNPPPPDPPTSLSLHSCGPCNLTWLEGRAGPDAATEHPSHHTLWHEYAGTRRSLMVFVDGACAFNGAQNARAGIGVYFGPNSRFNRSLSMTFQSGEYPTNQKAEINAVINALRLVRCQVMPERRSMCQAVSTDVSAICDATKVTLIIATDSSYVVEAMCRHYPTWVHDRKNKVLRNKHGESIQNSTGFLQINWEVEVLAMMGVQVQYYHVRREYNVNADRLAKMATQIARTTA